jgi:hypothetical protein
MHKERFIEFQRKLKHGNAYERECSFEWSISTSLQHQLKSATDGLVNFTKAEVCQMILV